MFKMKLEKIVIEDYKSIKKLEWDLNDRLTCLVGQNESGKSNLVEVFSFLNENSLRKLDFSKDTRRSSERYLNNEIPDILFYYSISKAEWRAIQPVLSANHHFRTFIAKISNATVGTLSSNTLKIIIQINEITNSLFVEYNGHKISLHNIFEDSVMLEKLHEILLKSKTKVIPIKEELNLMFSTSIVDLKNGVLPDSSIMKLLSISGLKNPAKLPESKGALKQYLKELNKNLNNSFVRKFYKQDDSIIFQFVHDSGDIYLEIEDNTESIYSIEERSEGFKYYFSLLIEMAIAAEENEDIIFLLDEPGLRLHPSGQRDLLNYLEQLSKNYRIIYTTHSPFLINRLYPNRVKIVDRDKKEGTVFKHKGFSKNWKPMRSALGLNIKDSFYYSDKTLLVEGPEDLIYISSLIHYFNDINKINFNTDVFSFIDAGGEANLPPMVQIVTDDDRPTLILIDSDSQSTYNKLKKKVDSIKNKEILDLIQVNEFEKTAKSIEDLLPSEILQKAVMNYCKELKKDGILKFVEGMGELTLDLSNDNESRYNNTIAPQIKKNYIEEGIDELIWENKKTPVSKVGIARHFELLLTDETYNKSTINFDACFKLVNTIAEKLCLIENL